MNIDLLSKLELLAIVAASKGLSSGSLGEWPYFYSALIKLNLPAHKEDHISLYKNLAILIYGQFVSTISTQLMND